MSHLTLINIPWFSKACQHQMVLLPEVMPNWGTSKHELKNFIFAFERDRANCSGIRWSQAWFQVETCALERIAPDSTSNIIKCTRF